MSRWSILTLIAVLISAVAFTHPGGVLHGWSWEGEYWSEIWAAKWFFLVAGLAAAFAGRIGQSRHWSLGIVIGYTLISAAWAFGWPGAYGGVNSGQVTELRIDAAYAFIAIMTISAALMFFDEREAKMLKPLLGAVCLINSAVVIGQWWYRHRTGAIGAGGLFGNPSISGCLIAITYPFATPRSRPRHEYEWDYDVFDWYIVVELALFLMPLIAILMSGTSQPILVLWVVCIAAYWRRHHSWTAVVGIAGMTICIALTTIALTTAKTNRSAFDDSGRVDVWRTVFFGSGKGTSWLKNGRIVFGQGTGTAKSIVPHLQAYAEAKRHKEDEGFAVAEFMWMHSDILQILFENGFIGFALFLLMAGSALIRAWRTSAQLFAALCGYGATMIANFPTHMAVHAFVGAALLTLCFPIKNNDMG